METDDQLANKDDTSPPAEPAPSRLSIWTLVFAMPPAVTVLAQFSLLFFLGPVGEWLQTYWFPITRALWDKLFVDLLDWTVAAHIKDYLTAALFFYPSYVMARKRPISKHLRAVQYRRIAIFLGVGLLYLLAQRTFRDLWGLLTSGFSGVYWAYLIFISLIFIMLSVFTVIVAFNGCEQLLKNGRNAYLHQNTQHRIGGAHATALFLAFFMILSLSIGAMAIDLYEMATTGFAVQANITWQDFKFGPMPTRSFGTFFLGLFCAALLMGRYKPVELLLPTPRIKAKKVKSPWEKEASPKSTEALGFIMMAFILLALGFGVAGVGLLEAFFSLILITMVTITTWRFPERIVSIGIASIFLIGSAFVIDAVYWAKTSLENLI